MNYQGSDMFTGSLSLALSEIDTKYPSKPESWHNIFNINRRLRKRIPRAGREGLEYITMYGGRAAIATPHYSCGNRGVVLPMRNSPGGVLFEPTTENPLRQDLLGLNGEVIRLDGALRMPMM